MRTLCRDLCCSIDSGAEEKRKMTCPDLKKKKMNPCRQSDLENCQDDEGERY